MEAPRPDVWPTQFMAQGPQPSHMVPKANGWALVAGYMPASPPLTCVLCLGSLAILAFLSAISPTSDHGGTQNRCLALPIHGPRSSTLTYGPKGKWMGFGCGVHAGFTTLDL